MLLLSNFNFKGRSRVPLTVWRIKLCLILWRKQEKTEASEQVFWELQMWLQGVSIGVAFGQVQTTCPELRQSEGTEAFGRCPGRSSSKRVGSPSRSVGRPIGARPTENIRSSFIANLVHPQGTSQGKKFKRFPSNFFQSL